MMINNGATVNGGQKKSKQKSDAHTQQANKSKF